jgi:hypothetical protein
VAVSVPAPPSSVSAAEPGDDVVSIADDDVIYRVAGGVTVDGAGLCQVLQIMPSV